MSVTWTLKDATGANLTNQPPASDPLALNFNSQGYPYYSTYSSDIIYLAIAEVDSTGPVTIVLSPDTSGYTLDETLSDPTEDPPAHNGVMTWTNSAGVTTLTFTAPSTVRDDWDWIFGGLTPPIALKMKVRLRRV